jgi:spore maturation protein CgeB
MTMKVILYTHSLMSDWNHGNAHFLRGILKDLEARGHETLALEPADGWSRRNLVSQEGERALASFRRSFPTLKAHAYADDFDHEAAIADADIVIVHEWTDPSLVTRIGRARRGGGRFTLLFHDTHHRGISDSAAIADLALSDYDVVLAFGEALRERYVRQGWGRQVLTWHEAADTTLFRPLANDGEPKDLVWIGNWGDDERETELDDFLISPARRLRLTGTVHGVRYPERALARLASTRLAYGGWLANVRAPEVFARHRMTVHVPRRPYTEALPGIPTIRVFEALACGIPLICAPWRDVEGLFREGDFLRARNGAEMERHMRALREDDALAERLARGGLETIRRRHTCTHRVDQLLGALAHLGTERVRSAVARQEAAQ